MRVAQGSIPYIASHKINFVLLGDFYFIKNPIPTKDLFKNIKFIKNIVPNNLIVLDSSLSLIMNNITLQSYENNIEAYVDGTVNSVSGDLKKWLDESIKNIPLNARILELGSGFGRDAFYLQSQGYKVECSDAAKGFVELLIKNGLDTRVLNILEDDINLKYDLIFANAVLLHFDPEEVKKVLEKILKSLNTAGRFAFTLKQGEGEQWSNDKLRAPRYFCFWNQKNIVSLIENVGFNKIQITDNNKTKNSTWLHIIACR